MGKGKLQKFAEMAQNPLVVECPNAWEGEPFALKGSWHEEFFHSAAPIVLELGCGRGRRTLWAWTSRAPACGRVLAKRCSST